MAENALAISQGLFKKTQSDFDPVKQYDPVALLASSPLALVVANRVPAHSVQELIALAHQMSPKKMNYASAGIGSVAHLTFEVVRDAAGIDAVHIPYKGGGQAMGDIIAGQVEMHMASIQVAANLHKAGQIRALAVTSIASPAGRCPTCRRSRRPASRPPTSTSRSGTRSSARRGMPDASSRPGSIAAVRSVMSNPKVRERLAKLDIEPDLRASPGELGNKLHERDRQLDQVHRRERHQGGVEVIGESAKRDEAIFATCTCASEARLLRGVYPWARRRRDPRARNDNRQQEAKGIPMPARAPWIDHFGDNFLWSNATLVIKGMAPYGVVALEEIDRVCERLKGRQHEPHAWFEEWGAMGALVEGYAIEAEKAGRKHTAGDYYLRAGNYLYNAERFLRPGPEKRTAGERAFRSYHAGIRLRHPNIERVEVPYENTTLPALFMRAPVTGPAPTGRHHQRHGQLQGDEHLLRWARVCAARTCTRWHWTGPARAKRCGCAASTAATTTRRRAALRSTTSPSGVTSTAKRVAIMGYSFGGYYSARIAAFEKRYAAGISLSALHWDLAAWQTRIKEKNQNDPKAVAQSNFQFQWVVNAATADDAIEVARKFSLKDVAKNITCPYLVTHGGNDRVVPVENAPKLFEAIGAKKKVLKIFSTEEGGAEHAHVDNRQVGIDFAADWLAENM